MTVLSKIRFTIVDLSDALRFEIPARFLTVRNVAVLARIPSRRFQQYLWNVIDSCEPSRSPEELWHVQALHVK